MSSHLGHSGNDVADEIREVGEKAAGRSEWEDALIKHNIIQAQTVQETQDDQDQRSAEQYQQSQQIEQRMKNASLDGLDELEDDMPELDDRILQQYRAQRIADLTAMQARAKFGTVTEIRADEFVAQVTDASKECTVIALLYRPGLEQCEPALAAFPHIARRHPEVKFIRIVASDAIANYPDRLTPTVLVYRNRDIVAQLVGLTECGGIDSSQTKFERALVACKAFESKSTDSSSKKAPSNVIRSRRYDESSSDDDSD